MFNKVSTTISLMTILLFISGCEKSPEMKARERRIVEEYSYNDVQKMTFIREERSGLCFGYLWGGAANGGPAISEVDCEKVEKLLVNK